ncbi:MAG TPA: nitroreductase family deazaflavin-dependent oxidoreductase [Candidatus Limnocylindrales bacterium]|jgi:deazaflavin-dependent oxidoreductase (nitroreductase family)
MADFNQALIDDLRAHHGEASGGHFKGRPMLILTTTGAKTNELRTAPLTYSRDGDRYVIVASKGGAPNNPAWYHNLKAHPGLKAEVGGQAFEARATVVDEPERRRLYDQHAASHTGLGFKEYESKTTRVIPVIVLDREASASD